MPYAKIASATAMVEYMVHTIAGETFHCTSRVRFAASCSRPNAVTLIPSRCLAPIG
jgi:hypothetical protein